MTLDDILDEIAGNDLKWRAEVRAQCDRWLARGDSILVYENQEFGHPDMGSRQITSYGSHAAMLEADRFPQPPMTLPDIGSQINWRYQLTHRFDPEE